MARNTTQRAAASAGAVTENNEASRALVANQGASVPAFFNDEDAAQTGSGVSNTQDDTLIPMARVLQPLSPQVLAGNPDQIQGALAGDILIRNAPKSLIKGQQGFKFQSCFFYKDVVEWRPRTQGGGGGNGFVKRWPQTEAKDVPGAQEVADPRDASKKIWINSATQNWLVETRYHVGYIVDDEVGAIPCYIPFSSTGHSVSKQWMFNMTMKKINGRQADSFSVIYLLRTKQRTRNNQTWFVFDVTDAGELDGAGQPSTLWVPTKADWLRGKELAEAMASGAMSLGDQEDSGDGEGGAAQQQPGNGDAF